MQDGRGRELDYEWAHLQIILCKSHVLRAKFNLHAACLLHAQLQTSATKFCRSSHAGKMTCFICSAAMYKRCLERNAHAASKRFKDHTVRCNLLLVGRILHGDIKQALNMYARRLVVVPSKSLEHAVGSDTLRICLMRARQFDRDVLCRHLRLRETSLIE